MSHFSFSSLRVRLFLLVLLAMVPVVGLVLYTGAEQRQVASNDARRDALDLAQRVSDDQAQIVESGRQLLVALAQLPDIRNYDDVACNALLADLFKQYRGYIAIGATKTDGEVFCHTAPTNAPPSLAERDYFQAASQKQAFVVSAYRLAGTPNKSILTIVQPVVKAGELQAAMFAELDLQWVNELVKRNPLPPGSTLTVFDARGTILAHYPDGDQWLGRALPETSIVSQVTREQAKNTAEIVGSDGVSRLYGFMPLGVKASGAYVSVGIPVAVAYAPANSTLIRNVILLGVMMALAFAGAWLMSNWFILRPITALVNATRRLSSGDWKTRSGLRQDSGELGQLAQSFDKMAAALEQRETARRQAEESLRQARNQLNKLVKERTTELLEVHEQLEETETQLHTQESLHTYLVAHFGDLLYRTDEQGRFTFCSDGFVRLLQYTRDELMQMVYLELVPLPAREAISQFYEQQVKQQTLDTYHELPLRAKDGRELWLGQHVQLLMESERMAGFQAIVRDLSARKPTSSSTEINTPSSAKPSENGGSPPSATNETPAPAAPTQPA
jgi:PAS domain S-box-containing protein